MTLYRDDKVQFGGMAVGGIRFRHMSHIPAAVTMALTATRANRKPFTVRPLAAAPEDGTAADPKIARWLDALAREIWAALALGDPAAALGAILSRPDVKRAGTALTNGAKPRSTCWCRRPRPR